MKAFGLAAILGVMTLGLVIGLSTGERVRANQTGTNLTALEELHADISAACEAARNSGTAEIVIDIQGDFLKFTVVKGANDLNGMDSRRTKNRDIIVASDDSVEGVELSGGKGDDILCGGPGPDTLNGESGNDFALGGPCTAPRCVTQPPNQIIDDTFNGGAGNDHFFGEDGNDFLNGGGNNDTLVGGPGNDEAWGGVGTSPAALWPWLSPFMRGGSGDDLLIGGTGGDDLHGGSGDDVLIAGVSIDDLDLVGEVDELYGGNHNDDLYGSSEDIFDGGWHQDYCSIDGVADADLPSCEKLTENTDYP